MSRVRRRVRLRLDIHEFERPFLEYFRSKRVKLFYDTFDISSHTRVLDLGGTDFFWELARRLGFPTPKVTIVNIDKPRTTLSEYIEWRIANALQIDLPDNSFDIVFCNSLIEHLSSWEQQSALAHEARRLAPRHFVQTPSRRFPIEPHFLTPAVHWLPKGTRARMIRNFTVWGVITRPSSGRCHDLVEEIRLLGSEEMVRLFPSSELRVEKFLGFQKSLIALQE